MCTAPQYDVTESLAQLVDLRTKSLQSVPFRNDIRDLVFKGILDILIEYRHCESEQLLPMPRAFIRSRWGPPANRDSTTKTMIDSRRQTLSPLALKMQHQFDRAITYCREKLVGADTVILMRDHSPKGVWPNRKNDGWPDIKLTALRNRLKGNVKNAKENTRQKVLTLREERSLYLFCKVRNLDLESEEAWWTIYEWVRVQLHLRGGAISYNARGVLGRGKLGRVFRENLKHLVAKIDVVSVDTNVSLGSGSCSAFRVYIGDLNM